MAIPGFSSGGRLGYSFLAEEPFAMSSDVRPYCMVPSAKKGVSNGASENSVKQATHSPCAWNI